MKMIQVPTGVSKQARYESLLPQIYALIEGERDLIANLANISAALKEGMGFFWVGFYLVRRGLPSLQKPAKGSAAPTVTSHGELVLGPFQGPVACTRIAYEKGVCGQAWAKQRVVIVPDVSKFPGHIACSSRSRSEIVIPFFLHPPLEGEKREVMGVLDVDSEELNAFDATDEHYLSALLQKLMA